MTSTLSHDAWMRLAEEEYARLDALLATLTSDQWAAPTECPGWTVRDMVAHLTGAAAATASVREQLRQQRLGARHQQRSGGAGTRLDAVNQLQIAERAGVSPEQLRAQLASSARAGLQARRRLPGVVRALRFPFPPPLGTASLGFLNDIVYTRDAWMHRLDVCRALGLAPQLTADHDGALVAEAARAWLSASGRAAVTLTGPVGVSLGAAGPDTPSFDGVEFARALSGRGTLPGIRSDLVLF